MPSCCIATGATCKFVPDQLTLTALATPNPIKQLLLDSLEAERQWRRSNWKYLPAGLLLAAGAFLAGAAWHQQASSAAAGAGGPSGSSGVGSSSTGSGSSGGWR